MTRAEAERLQLDGSHVGRPIVRGQGCEACAKTGYRGRKGIFELLAVDETIQELIVQRAKTGDIEQHAMRAGMRTLRKDAIDKVLNGETTLEEIERVTQQDAWAEAVGAAQSPQ